jgi:hypothetical protein
MVAEYNYRASLFVRVFALPVIEDECGLRQCFQWVLLLRSFLLGLIVFFIVLWLFLCLGCSFGSLCLRFGLFLWGRILDSFLNHDRFLNNSSPDWLGSDRFVPSSGVWVRFPPLLVQNILETSGDERRGEQISKGNALANKVSVDEEVLFEGMNGFLGGFGMIVDTLLVVRVSSNQWPEPTSELRKDLCIGIRHPAKDGDIVLLRLAEESGLLILGCDCPTMSDIG